MSDALYRTLEGASRNLERGIAEAEDELLAARERCLALEREIRSLRIQQQETITLERPAIVDDPVVIPEAAPEARQAPTGSDGQDAGDELEIPTSYMPMLEELWEIARRDDST